MLIFVILINIISLKFFNVISKEKLRRLVRTPTAVDTVARVAEYTETMLAYAESARAATESATSSAEKVRALGNHREGASSRRSCEDRPSRDHEDVWRRGELITELNVCL